MKIPLSTTKHIKLSVPPSFLPSFFFVTIHFSLCFTPLFLHKLLLSSSYASGEGFGGTVYLCSDMESDNELVAIKKVTYFPPYSPSLHPSSSLMFLRWSWRNQTPQHSQRKSTWCKAVLIPISSRFTRHTSMPHEFGSFSFFLTFFSLFLSSFSWLLCIFFCEPPSSSPFASPHSSLSPSPLTSPPLDRHGIHGWRATEWCSWLPFHLQNDWVASKMGNL